MSRASRATQDVFGTFVSRAAALPPASGASVDLFSVSGLVAVTSFFGFVTVAVPNASIDFDLAFDPDDGGTDVALATLLAVDNTAAGTWLVLNGTTGGALVAGLDVSDGVKLDKPLTMWAGDIELNVAGGGAIGTTCRVRWGLTYVALSNDGSIVAV